MKACFHLANVDDLGIACRLQGVVLIFSTRTRENLFHLTSIRKPRNQLVDFLV